jgi:VanZ family protein
LKYWPTIIVSLGILVVVLLPGSTIPNPKIVGLDKVVHFTMFFIWIIAVSYDFSFLNKWILLLVGIFFSVLTELFQLLVDSRSFEVYDVLADAAGVIVGLLLSPHILSLFKK